MAVLLAAVSSIAAMELIARRSELPILAKLLAWIRKWEAAVIVYRSLLMHHEAGRDTLAAFLTSIFVALGTALSAVFIARALQLNIDFTQMLVILAFVICMMSLPISVAGHGVREAAFVIMFMAFDVKAGGVAASQGHAIAFSLIYYLLHLFWGLVGGAIYLAGGSRLPSAVELETLQDEAS